MRYLRLSVLLVLAAALLVGPAAPLRVPSPQGDMVVKHKWGVIPDNWRSLGPPPDESTIDLHIALQPNQKNALIDTLYEVSQPGHPKYGAHLSREQLAELVAPHPNTLELVSSWLEHNGVSPSSISTTHGGDWLTVADVPVPQANVLLGASYELYYHAGRNDTILRTVGYSLPLGLHKHVQTIIPTTAFTSTRLLPQTSRHHSGGDTAPNATSGEPVNTLSSRQERRYIVPSVLRSMYGTATYRPAVGNNRLGIVGYDDEYPDLSDQAAFMHQFRDDAEYQTISFETINRNALQGYTSARANMFAQYAMALTYPIPITFYRGTGARLLPNVKNKPGPGDAMQQWLKWALDVRRINPQTIALITQGTREEFLPPEYAKVVCHQFAKLGATGITILVPSGDSGVGQDNVKYFYVNFPASCPWVTSVGGTTRKAPNSETEVASFFSAGGFSDYFKAEPYQKNQMKPFLDNLVERNMYPGLYAPGGRGVPDISAQSSGCLYVFGNQVNDMDSTACGTSTAAAIFSMLNDLRISQGFGGLGWINPWLYGTGWIGFTDITEGNNPGCKTKGFYAGEGWDPVTGVGTPDFTMLQTMVDRTFAPPPAPQPVRRNRSCHDEP